LENQLTQLVKNHSVVVLSEANSNLYHEKFFRHIDRYIFNFTEEDFKIYAPDLLITVGRMLFPKSKTVFKKSKPKQHWHLDEVWQPDTYFALTEKIEVKPEVFFSKLLKFVNLEPKPYFNLWDVLRDKKDAKHEKFLNSVDFSDFYFFNKTAQIVPENYNIHFSNSSAIRYAQLLILAREEFIATEERAELMVPLLQQWDLQSKILILLC
jgi:2-succinyl-5-enolpyruvyl-6-hydroxy-3-cyclohexene-1-carboxylate synthase